MLDISYYGSSEQREKLLVTFKLVNFQAKSFFFSILLLYFGARFSPEELGDQLTDFICFLIFSEFMNVSLEMEITQNMSTNLACKEYYDTP